MRKTIGGIALSTTLCLGLFSGAALLAQDSTTAPGPAQDQAGGAPMHHGGMHGPMSPDQELSHLTKNLSLTSDQQTQIKPILQDRHDQMMQMHQDASMSRPDRMAKMKALDESSNTKLEAVLTGEQKTKYEKMIADRKEHMQQERAMHGNGDGPPPAGGDAQPQ